MAKSVNQNDSSYIDNNMLFGVYKGEYLGLSLNNKKVNRSANVLVIGGTGTGKTFKYIKPNILQENCSMIITDPSGDIFRSFAPYLLPRGYNVYLFNASDFTMSNHYNPLVNVYDSNGNISETKVDILVDLYMKNAKAGKESGGSDPFWDKSEKAFLNKALLITEPEAIFTLKKDLICNNGVFKADTIIKLSCIKRSEGKAEYKVVSSDAEDVFLLTDELTPTDVQNFFEDTFELDVTATKDVKQVLEENKRKESKLSRTIECTQNVILISAGICVLIITIISAVKDLHNLKIFVIGLIIFLISIISFCILNDIEKKKINKIHNSTIENINFILKDSDINGEA